MNGYIINKKINATRGFFEHARQQLVPTTAARHKVLYIAILVQLKVVKLELISKSRHPLFQLVTFLGWSHILTSAYISKDFNFSQAPSPEVKEDLGETETHEITIEDVGAEAE